MSDTLHELLRFDSDPFTSTAVMVGIFLLYLALGIVPSCGILYLVYFLVTLPMRRNQRARMFLDWLELGLKQGRTPEETLVRVAASRDRSLGARFHLLAAYLENGLRLSQGLERVPRLLPPQVNAMLRTGDRLGDTAKVLPACRKLLADGTSQTRSALNYLLLLIFAITPATFVIPIIIRTKVLPAYLNVFVDMSPGTQLPAFSRLVFGLDTWFVVLQVGLVLVLWLAAAAYLGGPRLSRWLGQPRSLHWLHYRLPWRRKRLQRDFSAMLAVLLDARVPEGEALSLAAEATANREVVRRAGRASALLAQGATLPEALGVLDDSGELRWRLTNAFHRGTGFLRALEGWHEALDAKAFQLEQSAAQTATTALVLVNGFLVGCVVVGAFLLLIQLLYSATLW